jgi:hypothetical protein
MILKIYHNDNGIGQSSHPISWWFQPCASKHPLLDVKNMICDIPFYWCVDPKLLALMKTKEQGLPLVSNWDFKGLIM